MSRVLVIEDDVTVARGIRTQLEKSGHSIAVATDGEEGLVLAASEYFDAITLDRMLPKMDGLAVIKKLREKSISVPVLVISALSDVDERIAGLRAGGDDFAIDSKLRGCDVVKIHISDIAADGRARNHEVVVQKNTKPPVQFELAETARKSYLLA